MNAWRLVAVTLLLLAPVSWQARAADEVTADDVRDLAASGAPPADLVPRMLAFMTYPSVEPVQQAAREYFASRTDDAAAVVDRLLDAPNESRDMHPVSRALAAMGPVAVPRLVDVMLETSDNETRSRVLSQLKSHHAGQPGVAEGISELLRHEDENVRLAAANALRDMGPAAAPAVEALVQAMHDESVSYSALLAVTRLGVCSTDVLDAIETLRWEYPELVEQALIVLGAADRAMNGALWTSALSERHGIPVGRVEGLGFLVVPQLMRMLSDAEPKVRVQAEGQLARLGDDAHIARGLLARIAKGDPDASVRAGAFSTMERIGGLDRGMVLELQRQLDRGDAEANGWNVATLIRYHALSPKYAPDVVREIAHPSEYHVDTTAYFSDVAEKAAPVVPDLIALLASADKDVVRGAADALRAVGPAASSATPVLERLAAGSVDPSGPSSIAAQALARIEGAESLPFLLSLLESTSDVTRWAAFAGLRELGPQLGPAIPRLIELIDASQPMAPDRALNALLSAGPALAPYSENIAALLDSADRAKRIGGLTLLASMGDAAAPYSGRIIECAADADASVRAAAAGTIGALSLASDAALEALVRLIADPSPQACESAALSITHLGPAAGRTAQAIVDRLRQPAGPGGLGGWYGLRMIDALAATRAVPPDGIPLLWDIADHNLDLTARHAAMGALLDLGEDAGRVAVLALETRPNRTNEGRDLRIIQRAAPAGAELAQRVLDEVVMPALRDSSTLWAASEGLYAIERMGLAAAPYLTGLGRLLDAVRVGQAYYSGWRDELVCAALSAVSAVGAAPYEGLIRGHLGDQSLRVRVAAARALLAGGVSVDAAVATLRDVLMVGGPTDASEADLALCELGPMWPRLIGHQPTPGARTAPAHAGLSVYAKCLLALRGLPKEDVEFLKRDLRSALELKGTSDDRRVEAEWALAVLGEGAPPVDGLVAQLHALRPGSLDVVKLTQVARMLGLLGPAAREAVPDLRRMLRRWHLGGRLEMLIRDTLARIEATPP